MHARAWRLSHTIPNKPQEPNRQVISLHLWTSVRIEINIKIIIMPWWVDRPGSYAAPPGWRWCACGTRICSYQILIWAKTPFPRCIFSTCCSLFAAFRLISAKLISIDCPHLNVFFAFRPNLPSIWSFQTWLSLVCQWVTLLASNFYPASCFIGPFRNQLACDQLRAI